MLLIDAEFIKMHPFPKRLVHYGYPYAAPVLRRDYRLLFVLLCVAGFIACMWGVFA